LFGHDYLGSEVACTYLKSLGKQQEQRCIYDICDISRPFIGII